MAYVCVLYSFAQECTHLRLHHEATSDISQLLSKYYLSTFQRFSHFNIQYTMTKLLERQ